MSIVGKKPFVEKVISYLSEEELVALKNELNSSSALTDITYSDLESDIIDRVHFKFGNIDYKDGIIVKNDNICVLFVFYDEQKISIYNINLTENTYKEVKEYCTIAELRSVLSDYLIESGAGEELTPELLSTVLEGSEYISVDENEAGTKLVAELDMTKVDEEITEDSDNLATSGAVYEAVHSLTADDIMATNAQSVQDNLERIDAYSEATRDIAEGKNSGYVISTASNANFNSSTDTITATSIETTLGDEILTSDLRVGDIVYVVETDLPDRWYKGNNQFGILETKEVDLSSKLDASKSAVASVGGLVIPTPALTDEVVAMLDSDKSQKFVQLDDQINVDSSDVMHVVGVQEQRNSDTLNFWSGTQTQYDDITTKSSTTIYFIKES